MRRVSCRWDSLTVTLRFVSSCFLSLRSPLQVDRASRRCYHALERLAGQDFPAGNGFREPRSRREGVGRQHEEEAGSDADPRLRALESFGRYPLPRHLRRRAVGFGSEPGGVERTRGE